MEETSEITVMPTTATMFTISLDDRNPEQVPNISIQEAFQGFLKKKKKKFRRGKRRKRRNGSAAGTAGDQASIRSEDEKAWLRQLFLDQCFKYVGTPYAKRYWTPEEAPYQSKLFLDCCGLVRRAMWDLKREFGFTLGPWNQGYFFDCLPDIPGGAKDALPGDLVFVEGVHYSPKARPQKHNITHVEVWLADGDRSLGSRWHRGFVQVFDSYQFVSSTYQIQRYIFKSIEPWLCGVTSSHCPEHPWRLPARYKPSKYSIFFRPSIPVNRLQTPPTSSSGLALCEADAGQPSREEEEEEQLEQGEDFFSGGDTSQDEEADEDEERRHQQKEELLRSFRELEEQRAEEQQDDDEGNEEEEESCK